MLALSVAALVAFVPQACLQHGALPIGTVSSRAVESSSRGAVLSSSRAVPPVMCAASPAEGEGISPARNVLGGELQCCCADVGGSGIGTGFYRDGHCSTGQQDEGRHTVCMEATAEFLEFSKAVGNDLSTPIPQYMFPGVKPGDRWCLCAQRWVQAQKAGAAPKLYLLATHEKTLQHVSLDELRPYAMDGEEADALVQKLDSMRDALEKSLGGL